MDKNNVQTKINWLGKEIAIYQDPVRNKRRSKAKAARKARKKNRK